MVDEPDERAAIHDSLLPVYEALSVGARRDADEGRAEPARPSASAACACPTSRPTRTRLATIRAMLERHGLLVASPA